MDDKVLLFVGVMLLAALGSGMLIAAIEVATVVFKAIMDPPDIDDIE